jgi:hypothetical protein
VAALCPVPRAVSNKIEKTTEASFRMDIKFLRGDDPLDMKGKRQLGILRPGSKQAYIFWFCCSPQFVYRNACRNQARLLRGIGLVSSGGKA